MLIMLMLILGSNIMIQGTCKIHQRLSLAGLQATRKYLVLQVQHKSTDTAVDCFWYVEFDLDASNIGVKPLARQGVVFHMCALHHVYVHVYFRFRLRHVGQWHCWH
jgi:hypothetical protein